MTEPTTLAAATQAIEAGSKSFAAAARLFGPSMREGAVLLYAWCRHCDDVVDGQHLGFRTRADAVGSAAERLARLEDMTRSALAGQPGDHPAFIGLAEVVRRHHIPEVYPLQHLAGFRMDVEGRTYRTIGDTLDYAYHVAGVVGLMMAHVMGVRDPETLDRASDLGLAFQLTNIARDIVEDAGAGRVYLPAEWLAAAEIPPDGLADPIHRDRLAAVASRLVEAAEPYYASARIGIRALPPRAAWAIATALGIYRAIGFKVRRLGPRAWDQRVSTSAAAKLRHAATGGLAALSDGLARAAAPERSTLYGRPR